MVANVRCLPQETGDLEELVIHILVEDIAQEEILALCHSQAQQESIRAVYRELPNIRKAIGENSAFSLGSRAGDRVVAESWL